MTKVLLVDDDEFAASSITAVLEQSGLQVSNARSIQEALTLIATDKFDVLLSDLHMSGGGLTAVSAMRQTNPGSVTLLLNAFSDAADATHTILLQPDEIAVEPLDLAALVDVIQSRIARGSVRNRIVEGVDQILARSADDLITTWFSLVQKEEKLQSIPMTFEQRTNHLRPVLRELIVRLRSYKEIGSKELKSPAAAVHGTERGKAGYSASMLIEESRMLQVSIFQTLQNNLASLDLSVLLIGVMIIADEIDSQLSQAMAAYIEGSVKDVLPA